ncbi:hypothetical protein ACFQY7_25965 [Actinomadura luteofluorescens]|uniref:hypothetical protein n=1 Tax=Actinomadura luteofluorescens TaxID=46163 RepID=UPI00363001C3
MLSWIAGRGGGSGGEALGQDAGVARGELRPKAGLHHRCSPVALPDRELVTGHTDAGDGVGTDEVDVLGH